VTMSIFPAFQNFAGSNKRLSVLVIGLVLLIALGACESNQDMADNEIDQATEQPVYITFIPESEAVVARDTVLSYLSEKAWGFFGATCDLWVDLDYEFSVRVSGTSNGVIFVVFIRRPDRDLGSSRLTFRINVDGSVQGDNLLERSGIAEGCDKW
jgi:hypothetical protein